MSATVVARRLAPVPPLTPLAALDREIDQADEDIFEANVQTTVKRWRFGRVLSAERQANGGNQLPNGRLDEVCDECGKERTPFEREIQCRMRLAERCSTEEEVRYAVRTYGPSWRDLRDCLDQDYYWWTTWEEYVAASEARLEEARARKAAWDGEGGKAIRRGADGQDPGEDDEEGRGSPRGR